MQVPAERHACGKLKPAMRILPTEVVLVVAALEFQPAQLQEPPSTLTISACLADTIAAVFNRTKNFSAKKTAEL